MKVLSIKDIRESHDIECPVFIVGSGPTARNVSRGLPCYTCTLNLSSKICDATDFWFVNDANFLNEFSEEKLSTINYLFLPEYPHSVIPNTYKPSKSHRFGKLKLPLQNVCPYNIQTVKGLKVAHRKDIPFIKTSSTGESALKILTKIGFKKFITLGIDPEGGRHPKIPGKKPGSTSKITFEYSPDKRYFNAHNRLKDFAKKSKIKILRVKTTQDTIFNRWNYDKVEQYFDFDSHYKEVTIKM